MKVFYYAFLFLLLLNNNKLMAETSLIDIMKFQLDSIVEINETVSVCSGQNYTFPDGFTEYNITEQIVHTAVIQTTGSGCDTIIEITVNIVTELTFEEMITVCPGDSYTYPDGISQNNIFGPFTHSSILQTMDGICDSIVVTYLDVYPAYNILVDEVLCFGSSYTFPDGTVLDNITGLVINTSALQTVAHSCDSIIVTTINVTPANTNFETVTICSGDSYVFPDGTIEDNITATLVHNSSFPLPGSICDSLIITTVHVNPSYEIEESVFVCPGDSYTFPDGTTQNNITTETMHSSNFQTVDTGCDSLINTVIDIFSVNTAVSQIQNTLTADALDASYQWLDCNNDFIAIPGAINQSFIPVNNGNYAVEITENTCVDTSDCYLVMASGIYYNDFSGILRVSPNPTSGFIKIDLGRDFPEVKVKVSTLSGQLVFTQNFGSVASVHVALAGESGLYLIEIETGLGDLVRGWVVKE